MDGPSPVALVTGAAGGIGMAICHALANSGMRVVGTDLEAVPVQNNTEASTSAVPPWCDWIRADVRDENDVASAISHVVSEQGRLDVLVNNAGISIPESILETSLENWERVLGVNLTGAFLFAKEALSVMIPQKEGNIINIGSVVAHQGALQGHCHYAASKAGMLGLTRTLARTAAPHGIRVNCISPGIIATDLLYRTLGQEGVERLTASIPLGLGQPSDVGHAVAYLCGPGGRYVTGSVLDINGGLHMG